MAEITLEQLTELRAEIRADKAEIKADIEQIKVSVIQWVIGLFIGTVIVITSVIGVFTTNIRLNI